MAAGQGPLPGYGKAFTVPAWTAWLLCWTSSRNEDMVSCSSRRTSGVDLPPPGHLDLHDGGLPASKVFTRMVSSLRVYTTSCSSMTVPRELVTTVPRTTVVEVATIVGRSAK
jgi:hypothetical protein